VRTVDVKCNGKIYRRAVHLSVPLQLEERLAAKGDKESEEASGTAEDTVR